MRPSHGHRTTRSTSTSRTLEWTIAQQSTWRSSLPPLIPLYWHWQGASAWPWLRTGFAGATTMDITQMIWIEVTYHWRLWAALESTGSTDLGPRERQMMQGLASWVIKHLKRCPYCPNDLTEGLTRHWPPLKVNGGSNTTLASVKS